MALPFSFGFPRVKGVLIHENKMDIIFSFGCVFSEYNFGCDILNEYLAYRRLHFGTLSDEKETKTPN